MLKLQTRLASIPAIVVLLVAGVGELQNQVVAAANPRVAGDANGDCSVDIEDFHLWRNAYGATPGSEGWNPHVDFTRDRLVDIADYAVWRENQGSNCFRDNQRGHSAPRGRLKEPAPPPDLTGSWTLTLEAPVEGICSHAITQSEAGALSGIGSCDLAAGSTTSSLQGTVDLQTGIFEVTATINRDLYRLEGVLVNSEGGGRYQSQVDANAAGDFAVVWESHSPPT
jgi:hypothetical protein